jgi:hypothetical protein
MQHMAKMVQDVATAGFSSMSAMGVQAPPLGRDSSPAAILARIGPNLGVEQLAKGATKDDLDEVFSAINSVGDRIAVKQALRAAGVNV